MTDKPKFSSTMRIDLTADMEDGYDVAISRDRQTQETNATSPSTSQHTIADHCEIVGSADFRELLQSVYDAAIITTLEGDVIRGNRRAEQFFQYDVSRFSDLHITDLLSGSDDDLMKTICESLKDDRFILIQAYCARADKTVFPAEISVNLLHLSGQDYVSFFIRDVTLRKEAEERLRTGHAALQNSGNGIAVTDEDAFITYCNPAMAKLLQITPGQKPAPRITASLCEPGLIKTINQTITDGQAWSGEVEMLRGDGSTFFAQASVAPNLDADGNVVGKVWSLLDVSDQKRIQQELIEHNTQLAEDLSLANEFQQAFIQRDYPSFPPEATLDQSALEFGHTYIPCGAVGGDFFEIFSISPHQAGVFISDVMGHGVRSALIVATLRGLIEELGIYLTEPAELLSHMNKDLSKIINHPGHTVFATAFYMVFDLSTGDVCYAGAGHPFPILCKSGGKDVAPLQHVVDDIDPALGLFPATEYRQHTLTIQPGDQLIAYTDGLSEVEDHSHAFFGAERLIDSIVQHSNLAVSDLLKNIVNDAKTFAAADHFDDDVCLVAMRYRHATTTSNTD